jgi:hypothetical protein
MGGDHLDAVGCHQLFVERVTVITAIADQARREVGEEAGVERGRRDEMRAHSLIASADRAHDPAKQVVLRTRLASAVLDVD